MTRAAVRGWRHALDDLTVQPDCVDGKRILRTARAGTSGDYH